MSRTMLINMAEPEECRLAIVGEKGLEEVYLERDFENQLVGNIYLGKVMNIEPSMQAAFVDFGAQRNGFLHISDVSFEAILSKQQMQTLGLSSRVSSDTSVEDDKDLSDKPLSGESGENPLPTTDEKSNSEQKSPSPAPAAKVQRKLKRVAKKKVLPRSSGESTKKKESEKKQPKQKDNSEAIESPTVKAPPPKKRIVRRRVIRRKKRPESENSELLQEGEGVTLKRPTDPKRYRRSSGSSKKTNKRVSRKNIRIQDVLKPGQLIVVQVSREAIDHKGAGLTTFVSLAGRTLVLMPYQNKTGISRKIEDPTERQKLKQILQEVEPPKDMGYIVRTSGVGKSHRDFKRDLKVLSSRYDKIKKEAQKYKKPTLLYEEADLAIRSLRDVYSDDIDSIIVDNKAVEKKLRGWLRSMIPGAAKKIKLYQESKPLFTQYKIEEDFEKLFDRRVDLPSGASLVIEQTEAFVSIDVNTSRMKDKDQNTAIFNTNKEAAVEIARQLKLRDLGGLIICDFIDMIVGDHRREVEKIFQEQLKKDRSRVKASRISQFGLIEVSRQRMRQSFERAAYEPCLLCQGHGKIKNASSVSLKILREIHEKISHQDLYSIQISAHMGVVDFLQNQKRRKLLDLEDKFAKIIHLHVDPETQQGEYKVVFLGADDQPLEI